MSFPRLSILKSGDWLNKLNIYAIIPKKNHIAWATGLVALFLLYFYGYQVVNAYRIARNVESMIPGLKQAVLDKNWENTDKILRTIDSNATEIEYSINRLYPFTLLPGISSEANAAQDIITASRISIASGIQTVNWIKDVPVINEISFDSFSELTEAQKRELLKALSESGSLWEKVNNQTILSLQFLSQAQQETKIPLINSQINRVGSKLTQAQELFAQVQPWIAIAPSVLGYPNQKTYLLLLQNNTELRPTGGFIGTYGILKIRNAQVVSFTTDNVYNLDEPAKAYNTKVPPAPMQKYIKQAQWFFRDSNWDPDFPSSAQNAIQFYKDERGTEKHFDGVIALTPTVVENLMQVLGPVYVDDKIFTSDNLIDTLAYHVEKGFQEEGITIYNRKQIIDDVAQQLKEKLFTLSVDQMRALAPIAFESIDQRQMMFWFEDANVQRIVQNLNWDGRIISYQGDYLQIVDANLGSLKSDPAIKRTIDYTLKVADNGDLQATASITYEHTADFDWKTTRYRTYARVYVPQGSRFVKAQGNEEEIAIGNEHGKTVFGTFISIEPLDTETLSFTYILPKDLKSRILADGYSLYVQKQSGTIAHDLNLDITLPYKVDFVYPDDVLDKKSSTQVAGEWDLSVDREIIIKQK
ncbi:MAG: hypothetical protein CO042_02180 [Parcubacteria group bacterium CG_4_9_14_0_2_um_filter_41_8]|nr:MAG: hypothetical protein AUJ34_02480 [Parcubacteria group bacterium CG1_02_41_12]PIP67126.1 MAG: hypothetical protein COW93_01855 [Parcubacteria group bacterium CG22_combo_CG10-13_8_21_14_all_41_9]PJC40733.1 MAG: hypothetical protein CO042_02180 [Parcubacteria group bacterium CG_4_9_14_0_2_um_filter_41_8]